ncbi:MAG: ATP-binding cassette domain-containing protein [Rothia sp. (in: high G+C Gram-positive bacteria)]|uniref:ATP-binding cassette domain-containing protein n=1 Tax=Rothia sp. (in: high G+C Gram-positive bacteria) TaxID=1885016 RepID=UPI0026DF6C8B|nr:ATP-binding cassette domain-containing protein [Rothia sp. (in: high G+C Gram-positive bacteria)]MDO5749837.1 ATP-binding cassette domain-containing protein [Rothia sp. (in: high G+C Gram-positive bacteria)]
MTAQMMNISFSHCTYAHPGQAPLLDSLNLVIPPGITGIVGDNGTGKTTLLKLIIGELKPSRGSVSVPEPFAYVPQDLGLDRYRSLSDIFGITAILDALQRVEEGEYEPELYELIGNEWDCAERVHAYLCERSFGPALDYQGLESAALYEFFARPVESFSDGQLVSAIVAAALYPNPRMLILDEPSNNLDSAAQAELLTGLQALSIPVLMVSHDKQLLDICDHILELYSGREGTEFTLYPGSYTDYEQLVHAAQQQATKEAQEAKTEARKQQREWVRAQERSARSASQVRHSGENDKLLKRLMQQSSQSAAARAQRVHDTTRERAEQKQQQAQRAVRKEQHVYFRMPALSGHAHQQILSLVDRESGAHMLVNYGDRVRISGRNGVGKTSLIRTIVASAPTGSSAELELAAAGHRNERFEARLATGDVGYIPQRLRFESGLSLLQAIARVNPGLSEQEIRDALASLLFRADTVQKDVSVLSGGEKFRAAVACALLSAPAPRLLILDEPSNNVDASTLDWLIQVLSVYEGAVLFISHHEHFASALKPTFTLNLSE